MDKIKKVAFIYLTQKSGEYYVTDDPGYNIQRRPQLGLQYLSAVLEKRGINTNIFDQTVHSFNSNWLINKLREFDIAGFYCSDPQEDKVKIYCQKIKEKLNIPILVGGPSSFLNSDFLNYRCDIVVHGEGERSMEEIVDYYQGRRKLEEIDGISFKRDGEIISTPPRTLIENLDELPFPNRSKIDVRAYYDWFLFGMRKPYITMIASRGCVNRCAFCTSCKIWKYRYRQRSVDNVISEIDEMIKKYKVKYIAFQDDIFGLTNDWIEEFCKKLMARPYKIRWMAILHPLSIRNDIERILKLMKKAGCDTLSFGLQSAHPQILKNINRLPFEPEQLKKTLNIANKIGFITAVGYIIGLPGDTRETVQITIDYSLDCGSALANYYVLSVLRGSEIDEKYKNRKICELSQVEIEKLAEKASRKFYTRPKNIAKIIYFVIKNPFWVFNIVIKLPSILARIGFTKHRK